MRELNQKLSVISRVVVHPKYRTIGLGSNLVRDTLALAGTEYVEISAVMAKYNPFAEKAGMTRIADQHPPREALNILNILKKLGFDARANSMSLEDIITQLDETASEAIRAAVLRNM